jgi:acylglycerol lipase
MPLSTLSSYAINAVTSVFLFLFGWILRLMDPKHDLPYATPSRVPPDPSLFPRYFQNKQGIWLHWSEWATPKAPIGVVFLVGGLGEHTARYDALAFLLVEQGYRCFCLDHQGQGGSEGDRSYVEHFHDYVDDMQLFVRRTFALHPDLESLPRFVLGHSMGGLITVHLAYRDPRYWNGVVLSGAALQPDPKLATPFMKTMAAIFSDFLPKLAIERLNTNLISTNRPVVEFAIQDPLYPKTKMKARWGHEMLTAMEEVWTNIGSSTFPVLLVHGKDDRICMVEGSKRFYELAATKEKTFREYKDMYHEVLTESNRRAVIQDILSFLTKCRRPL